MLDGMISSVSIQVQWTLLGLSDKMAFLLWLLGVRAEK